MLKLVVSVLLLVAATAVRYDGYHIISVEPQIQAEVAFINSLVDENYEDRQVMLLKFPGDLMVAPQQVPRIKRLLDERRLQYTVVETDYQAYHEEVMKVNEMKRQRAKRRYDADIGLFYDYSYYPTIDELLAYADELVAGSSIARWENVGSSYQGYPMDLVVVNGDSDLPSIWVDSGIHAREWITPPTACYMLEQILYGTDADSVRMRTNFRWYFLIFNNPDGYEFTWSDDRMWRKTRSPNQGSPCIGTDPNRNFGYMWGTGGSSSNPCADDYMGSEEFSEVETQIVRDAVIARRDGMIAFVSIHSYSQMWLHAWGYTAERPNDYDDILRNSEAVVAAILEEDGRVFAVGSPPELLYVASGGSFDWAYGDQGLYYGYSPELRPATAIGGGFDPDPENIEPSGRETYAGFVAMVDDIMANDPPSA